MNHKCRCRLALRSVSLSISLLYQAAFSARPPPPHSLHLGKYHPYNILILHYLDFHICDIALQNLAAKL